jgi:hypothetical protein
MDGPEPGGPAARGPVTDHRASPATQSSTKGTAAASGPASRRRRPGSGFADRRGDLKPYGRAAGPPEAPPAVTRSALNTAS